MTPDRDRLGSRTIPAADRASIQTRRDVVSIVQAPSKRVEHALPSPVDTESGQDDATDVGLAVAIGVLEVEEIGRRAHIDATIPAGDGGRHGYVIGEERALVVHA